MDLGRAFGYVTEDERWLSKTLYGGVVYILGSFIIVGPIIFLGYMAELTRNILRGSARPLPEWDNWGQKLTDGFKMVVISIVYYLPLIVLGCIIAGLAAAIGASSDSGDVQGAASGLIACLQILVNLLQFVLIPFVLAGWARFIQTGDLAAALRIGDVFGMVRQQPGAWIILMLIQLLCGIVGGLGFIALCVGIFISYPYSQFVFAHAMAQTIAKTGGQVTDFGGNPPNYTPPTNYPPTYQ